MRMAVLTALRDRSSPLRLVVLTCLLACLWFFQQKPLTPEEWRLCRKVEAAQAFLRVELAKRGVSSDRAEDPHGSGFIGIEWSPITTTLGSLESKRVSTDPLWAARCLRWFDELGLERGDRVAVFSSSSFPGLLFSVLAAAESRGLRVEWVASLGASTWGANRPEAPWPVLAGILRSGGFLAARPLLYTLGGEGETGGGLSEEGRALLARAARDEGVELPSFGALAEIVARKMRLAMGEEGEGPVRLVVNVGGSEANMGRDGAALALSPGLLLPRSEGGDGVVGLALKEGVPVLHLLNLKALAEQSGISWDDRREGFVTDASVGTAALGLALFVAVLATHRRWSWREG